MKFVHASYSHLLRSSQFPRHFISLFPSLITFHISAWIHGSFTLSCCNTIVLISSHQVSSQHSYKSLLDLDHLLSSWHKIPVSESQTPNTNLIPTTSILRFFLGIWRCLQPHTSSKPQALLDYELTSCDCRVKRMAAPEQQMQLLWFETRRILDSFLSLWGVQDL